MGMTAKLTAPQAAALSAIAEHQPGDPWPSRNMCERLEAQGLVTIGWHRTATLGAFVNDVTLTAGGQAALAETNDDRRAAPCRYFRAPGLSNLVVISKATPNHEQMVADAKRLGMEELVPVTRLRKLVQQMRDESEHEGLGCARDLEELLDELEKGTTL